MIGNDFHTARAHFFKALGDPTRIRILQLLRQGKPLTVSEIYQGLGQAQNLISHHLACLRNCGLVMAHREGKQVYYRLRSPRVAELLDLVDTYIREVLEGILACEVVAEEEPRNSRVLRNRRRRARGA